MSNERERAVLNELVKANLNDFEGKDITNLMESQIEMCWMILNIRT